MVLDAAFAAVAALLVAAERRGRVEAVVGVRPDHARAEALRLINWKLAADADAGVELSPAEASATKIYGSELATEVYRTLMEVVGPSAGVTGDSDGAVLQGRLERVYRSALVMTFGGGTNEIQRDIIGYVGLGLPAAQRKFEGKS